LRQIAEIKQVNARLAAELRSAKEQLLAGEEAERAEMERRNAAFAQL
jgi:hypothetical protein